MPRRRETKSDLALRSDPPDDQSSELETWSVVISALLDVPRAKDPEERLKEREEDDNRYAQRRRPRRAVR
jgi:hypothetical protein